MAENEEPDGEEAAPEKSSGKSKKLILMIVLALVLIGLSVGGTLTVLTLISPPPAMEETDAPIEEVEPASKPAIYYPLKPPYIVNVDARGRRRYLQAELTLMLRDEDVLAAIELHKPSIDDRMTNILSGVIFEDIRTAEGKELLRLQCTQVLQDLFNKEIGKPGIEAVLFTNFVMQ